jgi:hypothetical protein
MSHVTYTIVEHDGGWAYKAGDVFSETFPTRQAAHAAAERAAQEQRAPGESVPIEFEDSAGSWHEEDERGGDRLTLRSRIKDWTWQDASQQREYPILSHRENN